MRSALVSLLSLCLAATSIAQDALWKKMQCSPGNTLLNAALWVQNSAEYKANARQVYANAQRALDAAIADGSWSATEQTNAANLPLAVILDLDETALNNIKFEARAIRVGVTYAQPLWDDWVGKGEATAVPGAGAFLDYAMKEKHVTPFYITNRKSKTEGKGTLANLDTLKYPVVTVPDTVDTTTDNVLMRGERPEWDARDKTPRRDWVAQRYRVLLLIGDDLNDFVNAADKSESERDALVEQYAGNWGSRWFILPNPMYGSWHDTLLARRTAGSSTVETPKDGCEEMNWKLDATKP